MTKQCQTHTHGSTPMIFVIYIIIFKMFESHFKIPTALIRYLQLVQVMILWVLFSIPTNGIRQVSHNS